MSADERRSYSFELISYQLGELKNVAEQGFARLDRRLDDHGERIKTLEEWRIREEATDSGIDEGRSEMQALLRTRAGIVVTVIAVLSSAASIGAAVDALLG